MRIRRVATLRTADDFRSHVQGLGIDLPMDDELESGARRLPLAQKYEYGEQ